MRTLQLEEKRRNQSWMFRNVGLGDILLLAAPVLSDVEPSPPATPAAWPSCARVLLYGPP